MTDAERAEKIESLRRRQQWRLPQGRLSPSKLKAAIKCMACFENVYVKGWRYSQKHSIMTGTSIHEGIEAGRKAVLAGVTPGGDFADLAVGAAVDRWDRDLNEIKEKGTPFDLDGDSERQKRVRADIARWTRVYAPMVYETDRELGLAAVEARALGLGLPMSEEEQAAGYDPVFPFQLEAYVDALHLGASTDIKTRAKLQAEPFETVLQQQLHGLSWWANGDPLKLGVTQLVKYVKDSDCRQKGHRLVWLNGDGLPSDVHYQRLIEFVLLWADRIDGCMRSGLFPPTPGRLCSWNHGYPKYWQVGGSEDDEE